MILILPSVLLQNSLFRRVVDGMYGLCFACMMNIEDLVLGETRYPGILLGDTFCCMSYHDSMYNYSALLSFRLEREAQP